jgi:membrane protein DedA with SNARE-associated domain
MLFQMFFTATILTRIQNLMGTWGYPVLFGLLFSCGLGLPLPEDVPLILAGYFIAIGKMHLGIAAVCAWLGIIGGDCMLYWFGYKYGLGITKVPIIGKHVTAKRIQYAERLFQRYGTWVVGFGRMFAGIRGAMVIAAGTIRFNIVRFLIADGLAAIVSGGLFMLLGHWAGKKLGDLEALREKIQHYEHYVLGGLILLVLLFVLFTIWRKRQHKPPVMEKALEKVVEKAEKSTVIHLPPSAQQPDPATSPATPASNPHVDLP